MSLKLLRAVFMFSSEEEIVPRWCLIGDNLKACLTKIWLEWANRATILSHRSTILAWP